MKDMFKYIIFDFDNTIYNYDLAYEKSLNCMFDEINKNYQISIEILNFTYNNEKKKFQNYCYSHASKHNKFIQIKKLFEALNIDLTNLNKYYNLFNDTFNNSLELYPDILKFIEFCSTKKIKLYILTNNICIDQINRIKHLNLFQYFQKIYTSEEFGIEKPDLKLFYYVIQDIGCHKNDIVKIGDNYKNDIEILTFKNIYSFWFNKNNLQINNKYLEFNNFNSLLDLFQRYYEDLEKFIEVSKFVGERSDLVQAGGGNTSFKIDQIMFIKSSGSHLSSIDNNCNYVGVNYLNILNKIQKNFYHQDKKIRESSCSDLINENIIFLKNYKPSIETSLHCITQKYTVHLHPIQFNYISALPNCEDILKNIFNQDSYCLINYFTPGIDLTLEILKEYQHQDIIFLKNHGVVFTNNCFNTLKDTIEQTINKLEKYLKLDLFKYHLTNNISSNLKQIFSGHHISYLSENQLINNFINSDINLDECFNSFLPDKVVYCGQNYVLFKKENINQQIENYLNQYNEQPKIFITQLDKKYLYISTNNLQKCKDIEQVLVSHFFCYNTSNLFLDNQEINYLNNWEAEKYRKII